jgi:tetratricopeptide (TPR) repeat protein
MSRIETLLNFLKDDPKDIFTRYAIGLEYVKLKETQKAVTSFTQVIELDPTYAPAYHQLGLLYVTLRKKDEARDILRQGIEAARSGGDGHAAMEMQETLEGLG